MSNHNSISKVLSQSHNTADIQIGSNSNNAQGQNDQDSKSVNHSDLDVQLPPMMKKGSSKELSFQQPRNVIREVGATTMNNKTVSVRNSKIFQSQEDPHKMHGQFVPLKI